MKSKSIILLATATLLVSCGTSQNGKQANVDGLKAAATAEASKTSVHYNVSGDFAFKSTYDNQTLKDVDIANLNANVSIKNLNGGILKAKASDYKLADIYGDGSVGKLDYKAYKDNGDLYASFSTYSGNANAYLKNGNLYADLSKLDLTKAMWNGESGANAPSKIILESVLNSFSFVGIGFSGFSFSTSEIESYILPYCTFSASGNAETASLSLTKDDVSKAYVSSSIATWVTNEMPKIDSDMQDQALIAAKNRFTSEIASIVPSFSLALSLTYDSAGLYSANIDLDTKISPNGADASADKKYVYDYDINLSINSRTDPSFPDLDASSYTKVTY